MKSTSLAVIVLLASASAWACSKNASDDDDSGGSSNTAAGGSSGAATGGTGGRASQAGASGTAGTATGPAITSAPPAWMPPADCGGIGDTCPNGLAGCSTKSTCQLEGYVCIPRLETGATALPSRTAETPYCAAYTCMTFEEASCFCTGAAGKVTPSCSSPSALAGLCAGKDAGCTSMSCCDGLSCVETNGGKRCEQPCQAAADCSTGCCTDLYDTGVAICAAMTACTTPCKKHGEACNGGDLVTPTDCCRGSCIQSDNPDFGGCRPLCSASTDCDTGCCKPFDSGSSSGFCTDSKYCSCPGDGEACGPAIAYCCDGMSCVGTSATDLVCRPDCTTDADCTAGKCTPLADNSASICLPCADHGAECGDVACCGADVCADTGAGSFSCHTSCTTDADCGDGGVCISLGSSGAHACR